MLAFTIIVPVYNVSVYLKRCIDSLINQTYRNFRVILVDDGSTDDSGIICDSYSSKYNYISTIHKKNGGLSSARNYGLKYATGDYVLFVDSDDWIDTKLLEIIHHNIKGNPVDFIKFGVNKIKNNMIINKKIPCFSEGFYEEEDIKKVVLPAIIGQPELLNYDKISLLSAYSYVYNRDFLINNGLTFISEREILNEDKEFNFRTGIAAKKISIIHDCLYYYDTREGSLTQKYIPDMFERKTKLLNIQKDYLLRLDIFSKYSINYYNNCIDFYYECLLNECTRNESKTNAYNKMKMILTSSLCVEALHGCQKKNLSLKARIIKYLMLHKFKRIIYFVYNILH